MNITIKPNDISERLDKFLLQQLPYFSRSFIQKQIKDGNILVNGNHATPHYKIKSADKIEANIKEKKQTQAIPDKSVKLKIIKDTPDFAVIEKPAGLIIHPAAGIDELTLVNGLLAKYPKIKNVGDDSSRPGIVHRLDKEASGLLVVAKTQASFTDLKKQFSDRGVSKEYIALVHGKLQTDDGIIDKPIGRSQTKGGKMAAHSQEYEKDREAKTEYEALERIKNYTLLKIKIHTGRTHQIRVHFCSIGHPIVGDKLYKIKKYKQINLGRLFLHASLLGLRDLTGKYVEYTSPLPEELENFLKNI